MTDDFGNFHTRRVVYLNEIDSMKKLVMVQVLESGAKRTRAYLYEISEWENFDFSLKS